MNYTIATVSNRTPTEWYYLQKEFYKSLKGHPVLNINYQHDQPWNGFSMKPKWLYRAIKEKLITAPYLIFTDSWDVVFACDPKEIIDKFLLMGVDVVVNTERNCFPGTYKEQYDLIEAPTEYKYLNSGFIVGKTDAILACLETMDLPNVPGDHFDKERNCNVHPEDQSMWQKVFLDQPVKIALDYYCELSQTLHEANMEYFDLSENRIKNKVTDSYPCILHFNGSAKDKLEIRNPILTKLNLL
jgi:hypothetical protein